MKSFKESPKLTVSVIITLVLEIYTLVSSNAELLGIDSKLMATISLLVTIVSMVWKQVKPDESAFKMVARHVGTRPIDPPRPPKEKED